MHVYPGADSSSAASSGTQRLFLLNGAFWGLVSCKKKQAIKSSKGRPRRILPASETLITKMKTTNKDSFAKIVINDRGMNWFIGQNQVFENVLKGIAKESLADERKRGVRL